jgi:hypothetical protein
LAIRRQQGRFQTGDLPLKPLEGVWHFGALGVRPHWLGFCVIWRATSNPAA